MSELRPDALVFFGATGDLAFKSIRVAPGDAEARHPRGVGHRRRQGGPELRPAGGVAHRRPGAAADTPVFSCDPQTWGHRELARVSPPGGWLDPVVER
jgi:hypothetical protein